MQSLPAFFFPTQTIIIDDNSQFLDSLSLSLQYNTHSYKFFNNPKKALSFINDNLEKRKWIKKYIRPLEEEIADHKIIDINISELHKEINNNERFSVITNIIVDFDMPIINGLEFCKEFENVDLNKILLTGTVDDKLAIDAFNNRLINYFIPKNSDNISRKLNDYIEAGANLYFNNLSQMIYTSIKTSKDSLIFDNNSFVNFIHSILEEKKIIEYYLIDENGSYLMVNKEGQNNILHINTDDDLNYIYNLALEEGLDSDLLLKLKNKSKILCYFNLDNKTIPNINSWQNHFYMPEVVKIDGRNYYYYYEENVFSTNRNITFKDYLNN
jgi:CheY-like chemotaxis protein